MNTFLILHHNILEVRQATRSAFYKIGFQSTESSVMTKEEMFGMLVQALQKLDLPEQQPVVFLLDHPWIEIKFLKLNYVPHKKALRAILSNALTKKFVRDTEQYDFQFYEQKQPDRAQYVVYAVLSELCLAIDSCFNQKKWQLAGIFPLAHWLLYEELLTKLPQEDQWFLQIHPWVARISLLKEGVVQNYWKIDLPADCKVADAQQKIGERLQKLSFSEPDVQRQVVCPEGLLEFSSYDLLTAAVLQDQIPEISHERLADLYQLLQQHNQLLNLNRFKNPILKELFNHKKLLAVVGTMFVAAILFLSVAFGLRWIEFSAERDALMAQAAQEVSLYDPTQTDFFAAKQAIEKELIVEEKKWENHLPFSAKTFTISDFLLSLSGILKKTPTVTLQSWVWEKQRIQLSGLSDSSSDIKVFIEDFGKLVDSTELNVERSQIGSSTRFSILFQSDAPIELTK